MKIGITTQDTPLRLLIRLAHETIHGTQATTFPIVSRLNHLIGCLSSFSGIISGIAVGLHHIPLGFATAGFAVFSAYYHMIWHIRFETEAVLKTPEILEPIIRQLPDDQLSSDLKSACLTAIQEDTKKTLLTYPAQIAIVFLQPLLMGLIAYGVVYWFHFFLSWHR